MKPSLLYQTDLFDEDISIAKKYFNVTEISAKEILLSEKIEAEKFRGSTTLCLRSGNNYKFADCLKWMSALHNYILNKKYFIFGPKRAIMFLSTKEEMFVRPVSPYKTFPSGIYNWRELWDQIELEKKNCNFQNDELLVVAPKQDILEEYRCVFVNKKLIDMDCYIENGEIREGEQKTNEEVSFFAKKTAKHDYFLNVFDFVLDFAVLRSGAICLIEVNSFNSSGFYRCNLDRIYKEYSK